MPGLHQVDRKPRDEEVGERCDAELAEIDSDQHPLAEKFFHSIPCQRICRRLLPFCAIEIREASPLFDGFDLCSGNQWMRFHIVDELPPCERKSNTEDSHE